MKNKLTNEEAIAKIRIMINNFNSELDDRKNPDYSEWSTQINREILLYKIEEVIKVTKVDGKLVIVEQIKSDEKKNKRKITTRKLK